MADIEIQSQQKVLYRPVVQGDARIATELAVIKSAGLVAYNVDSCNGGTLARVTESGCGAHLSRPGGFTPEWLVEALLWLMDWSAAMLALGVATPSCLPLPWVSSSVLRESPAAASTHSI